MKMEMLQQWQLHLNTPRSFKTLSRHPPQPKFLCFISQILVVLPWTTFIRKFWRHFSPTVGAITVLSSHLLSMKKYIKSNLSSIYQLVDKTEGLGIILTWNNSAMKFQWMYWIVQKFLVVTYRIILVDIVWEEIQPLFLRACKFHQWWRHIQGLTHLNLMVNIANWSRKHWLKIREGAVYGDIVLQTIYQFKKKTSSWRHLMPKVSASLRMGKWLFSKIGHRRVSFVKVRQEAP